MAFDTPTSPDEPRSSSIRRESMSPGRMGYRMPAEWEAHSGTWISWPHNVDTWPSRLQAVEPFFVDVISYLAEVETVHLLVPTEELEHRARQCLQRANLRQVSFHRVSTNDAWCRDYGATFVKLDAAAGRFPPLVAIDWGYNAWGGKYPPYDADDAVARQMAYLLQVPCVAGGMVLEGGAIDTNGKGILLTTDACVLDPRRNPGLDRMAAEHCLHQMLGTQKIIWLEGFLAGDDTDGHIDQLARFVSEHQIAYAFEDDPQDEHYAASQKLQSLLQAAENLAGKSFELIPLPGPARLMLDGRRLPAGYANFYLANELVLVPQYGDPRDDRALGLLRELFPQRRVIGIDSREAVVGLGAIHCLTQQVPAVTAAS